MFEIQREWPHITRDPAAILELNPTPYLGADWEWSVRDNKPTILGVSDGVRIVSVPHEQGKPYLIELISRRPDIEWVLHNGISADIPIVEKEGIHIPIERTWDTILLHWLTNMSLSKGVKKADDDEGERKGRGWNNIYAMSGFYLSIPNWKYHRAETCEGPCPECDVFGYNGCDSYYPVKVLPLMLHRARMLDVLKLYPLHRDLAVVLGKMKERGVLVNVPYVDKLRGEFATARKEYWDEETEQGVFPFNPNSPQQVVKYFKSKGISLDNAQEETIRDAHEDHDDPELEDLLDYKELGKGVDSWFAPRAFDYQKEEWKGYVGSDGFIHASLQPFTSTGRLACSNPNLQNISKRRRDRVTGESIGKKVRRAIVAPEGYWLVEADYSNAENRAMLHLAGYDELPNMDFHEFVRELMGISETDPFAIALGSARDAAKSVSHASNYLEGLVLLTSGELRSSRIRMEIAKGARIIFPEWVVFGKTVSFTGVNLSRRAFGSATLENRRRALDAQQRYFAAFPKLRDLQKKITRQVEVERCVKTPLHYCLASYGYELERLKTAAACWGSQPIAHLTKIALINADSHPNMIPVLQVHDSLLFCLDKRFDKEYALAQAREIMEFTVPEIPNMRIPVEVKIGVNWASGEKV